MPVSLSTVSTAVPKKTPPRIAIHGVGGVGKTSFAAQFPKPIFLQSPGETGLETLISTGQLKPVGRVEKAIESWNELLDWIDELFTGEHNYKTLVLDTAPGFCRLLHKHICETEYGGDWGPKGFMHYNQGYRECTPIWQQFLFTLDKLRLKRGMTIVLLMHTDIKSFKNPQGADYDRFTPDMQKDDWNKTFGWVDMCLFFNFIIETEKASKTDAKKIATGGSERAFFIENAGAYDAKGGRHGLPPIISLPDNPAEAYKHFISIVSGKSKQENTDGN